MTRYGFAIKALPQGGKPFGEEDENEQAAGTADAAMETAGPDGAGSEPLEGVEEDLPEDLTAAPAAPAENAFAPEDSTAPQATDAVPEGEGSEENPPPVEDDSRPWAGDMYSEGDETQPESAFAAYTGSDGEQAWLDQAPDGTLTGWVRDSTGQVWRYTDADAWATDVDGAQMTRTHGPEGEDSSTEPAAPNGPVSAEGVGVQESMFTSQ